MKRKRAKNSLDENSKAVEKQLELINDFYYCRPGKEALNSNTCLQ